MTSPMSAVAVTVSPPAPIPCSARQTISIVIEPARPDRADPTMKITMLIWNTRLRPNRSPSLPASTVAMVSVRMYEVATHET